MLSRDGTEHCQHRLKRAGGMPPPLHLSFTPFKPGHDDWRDGAALERGPEEAYSVASSTRISDAYPTILLRMLSNYCPRLRHSL